MLKEAWTLAIETLSWMEMRRLSEPLAFARTVKQLGIEDYDSLRFAHRLVSETVRRQNFIDRFINEVLKPGTIDEYSLGVQAFLRLYVYQTRIAKNWSEPNLREAESAANMARSILGWKTLADVEPFLGVLLTRRRESVFAGLGDEERVGLETFHPAWFVSYCFKLFGRNETIAMLEADVRPPLTYLRLNTLKAGEERILERLVEEGVRLEKVEPLSCTYRVVASRQPVTRTSCFKEGLIYVQDKGSCFMVEAANPQPGMTILDVCAAPGAKTTFLAQLMRNRGSILSVDYSRRRITVWKSQIARMGVEIAEPIIADARAPLPFMGEADVVVLDPPCTGTGTFGKVPSAKWRLSHRSVERMAEVQWQMLNKIAERVKTGGSLIYSTCSVTVEENEMVIEKFLKWHLEFSLAEIPLRMGSAGLRGLEKCRRLYPHLDECNGFFVARLLKNDV
ncbi:MAG TPA: RsmB/NOP family class I SAM-dependent RNA methyltransferase [Candidatus Eisenbacteria bacterium]|nr:RsmB/NOP family class I SAM-dependent RNA methyltransferase [Candidatus Eisenbacteria bacterium]